MVERGGVQGIPLSPYQVQVSYGGRSSIGANASSWFGPLAPISPLAPTDVAGRQWDFPAGYNLNTQPRSYSAITFQDLRVLADGYDLLRTVIETRKDQVAKMRWSIAPRDKKARGVVRKKAQIEAFLAKPDGCHGWVDWMRMTLEDLLVIDAPALYLQRNRAGDLLALDPVDGATIKPVIDDWGRTPEPQSTNGVVTYPVAYQQILKGYPAVDYTTRDLLYRPRNVRTHRVYGFSPVEQIVATVNIALRRQVSTLDHYTEGNVPDSLIGVPDTWTPDQIRQYQSYWDSMFEGNLAARRRAKFVPGGVAKTFIQTREPELKGEFDDWLARLVCFAFSISPQSLVKQLNRATAETQQQVAEEEGLAPILDWVKSLMDGILETEFDSPELEFAFQLDREVDEAQQAEILRGYVSSGQMTINESRAIRGQDPSLDPAADKLMALTATGFVPIDANTIDGKKANIEAFGAPEDNPSPAEEEDAAA